MKISVVIPIYNEEPLIERLGESLRSQTHQELEIIFVDDASTDGSLDSIEALRKRDPRISIVQLTANRGGGAPYNAGIDKSTGDYIFIHDADDQLTSQGSLGYLAEIAHRNDDDIVIGNTLSLSQIADEYAALELNKVTIRNLPALVYNHSVWNKLYRRKFLLENEIRFQEGIFAHDVLYSARTNITARSISITNRQTYFYSTGRQMSRALPQKITDARENVCVAMNLFESLGDPRLTEVSRTKTLVDSFNTMARAEQALSKEQMLEHLARWHDLLIAIPEQTIALLPEPIATFHYELRNEQFRLALKTWKKTQGYKRKIKQGAFQLLQSQLNNPKRARLVKFAKSVSKAIG